MASIAASITEGEAHRPEVEAQLPADDARDLEEVVDERACTLALRSIASSARAVREGSSLRRRS